MNSTQESFPATRDRHPVARGLTIGIPLLLMAGVLIFFAQTAQLVAQRSHVFPLDSYFYQSFSANIQHGKGPCTEWPQGPQNKYFPGYAYWWALFMPGNAQPEDALRTYVVPQTVLLALFMLTLIALGRATWRDWTMALCFAALASAAPIALKWSLLPLSELLAAVCITAIAAASVPIFDGQAPAGRKRVLCLACMAAFGAVGLITRIEVGYCLGVLVVPLVLMRRVRWTAAAGVMMTAALPLLIWQVWVTQSFHEPSYYVGEGAHLLDFRTYMDLFFFQLFYFLRVQNVPSPYILSNLFLSVLSNVVFLCVLVVALRGYAGRKAGFAAWVLIGFWLLHSLWYYKTDRYNMLVVPFGFVVLLQGMGWLINRDLGWFTRGGRTALAFFCLISVPVFCGHAWDNIWTLVGVENQQTFPENKAAILSAMQPEEKRVRKVAILTNISIPEARRLPGEVWFDGVFSNDPCMDRLPPLFAQGQGHEFIRKQGITHLALRPPVDTWIGLNASELKIKPIYSDTMVWIGRIEHGNSPASTPAKGQ